MEEYEGLTLGQILKCAFGLNGKRRITFGIIALAVFVATFGGVALVYNKAKQNYTTQFSYSINGFTESSGTYLDGTVYSIKDLYALDNLKSIKTTGISENSNIFASIDVETMYYNNDLSVVYNTVSSSNKNTYTYSLTVKQKYFSSQEQAKEFIEAVAETPIKKTNEIIKNTDLNRFIASDFDALSTSDKIRNLQLESNLITSTYNSLYTEFGDMNINSVTLVGISTPKLSDFQSYVSIEIGKLNLTESATTEDIATAKTELSSFAATLKTIYTELYTNNQVVYYDSSKVITSSGGISTAATVVLSAVAGLAIGGAVNLIMDLGKYRVSLKEGTTYLAPTFKKKGEPKSE